MGIPRPIFPSSCIQHNKCWNNNDEYKENRNNDQIFLLHCNRAFGIEYCKIEKQVHVVSGFFNSIAFFCFLVFCNTYHILLSIIYMANWGKILSRGNVEDRRSFGPTAAVGGLGITGLAILLVLNFLGGGNITDVLSQLPNVQIPTQQAYTNENFEGEDSYEVFASTVLGSNNDMWLSFFAENNQTYSPPKLVLFRTATQSLCGTATSQVGPHYCPLDKTIYLDETFFDELKNRFGANGGDVAEAYVIAHEVGHHIQNELGILENINDNASSIKAELQADCFAGLWAYSIKDLGVFEIGEIHEAIDAAAAVGDDRIQEKITGRVNPESWTHGSSQERASWFNRGYETGAFNSCNTFQ
jgi:predicted metalloprotease